MIPLNCEVFFRGSDTLKNRLNVIVPKLAMEYPTERYDSRWGVTVAHSVGVDELLFEWTRRVAIHPAKLEDHPDLWPSVTRLAIAHYFNHHEMPSPISVFWSTLGESVTTMDEGFDSALKVITAHLAVMRQLLNTVEECQVREIKIVPEGVSLLRDGVQPIGHTTKKKSGV